MSKENLTIMVVEDESLLLEAVTKKLELTGIKTVSCSSGKQAIDYLSNFTHLPDAIWLDYHLKDMDGVEFMAKMKEYPQWENVPVIVVSNSASQEKVHSMLALGAKQYVLKAEHRLDDIIETVKELINQPSSA